MVLITLLLIIGYFLLALILRRWGLKICALCAGVAFTWLTLLVVSWAVHGIVVDSTLIGILMGGSIVGFLYYLESRLPRMSAFKFPILVTLVLMSYISLRGVNGVGAEEVILIVGIWVIVAVAFLGSEGKMNKFIKSLVECCKRW